MALVRYEEQTIVAARNKIDTCNENILNSLKKIYEETNNISNILNTPKSNRNMAEMLKYLEGRINYVSNSKTDMNAKLLMVENTYKEGFTNTVAQMVGGNNG